MIFIFLNIDARNNISELYYYLILLFYTSLTFSLKLELKLEIIL